MSGGWMKVGLPGTVIVSLAIGIFVYGGADRAKPADAPAVQAVPVIATKVQQHDVPIILTGLGTVTALNTATIHSQITGLLVSVDFREGQTVKKGDLLAQIDPRAYQAQLDQAQATLEHDQAHLKNAQLNLQPKLGSWLPDLDRLLAGNEAKQARERLTLIRIFETSRGLGYDGGYDAVRRYAKAWRAARRWRKPMCC